MNAGLRNPDSFIVCHLRFDDDGARELTGMPITLGGGASVSATNARHHGMALQIGAGDYCQIAHNGALDFLYQNGVPWSIAMWMTGFDNTGGTFPSIIALQASVGRMVVMWYSAKRMIYLNIRNAENDVVVNAYGSKGPTTAGMHYLVITYDQALSSYNAKIYVDGTLLGRWDKYQASPSTGSSNTALNIGYHSARSSYGEFPMSIDEFIVYKGIAIDGTVVPTRRR